MVRQLAYIARLFIPLKMKVERGWHYEYLRNIISDDSFRNLSRHNHV